VPGDKARGAWTNWPGNVSADPVEIVHPRSEAEVGEIVAAAGRRGLAVRVVGAGHSFMPLCATDGVLLCLDRMTGLIATDPGRGRAFVGPGSTIGSLGDPLWDAGWCLRNQGDIDTQHIAGAVSTSTHGSGIWQQSFSGTARGFRVVRADGDVVVVDEHQPDVLAALQTSLGLLGVITQVELDVSPRFALREQIDFWPVAEILERWDDEMAGRRHFSFFWMPYAASAELLFLSAPDGTDLADHGFVKRYDMVGAASVAESSDRDPSGADVGRDAEPHAPGAFRRRVDRPYRIYPDPPFDGEIVHRELEYMVPFEYGKDAFLALRSFVLNGSQGNEYPIEIRAVAADDALLSPFYRRDSISVSICGHRDRDHDGFLRRVHDVLEPFEPRPHWGKVHYFDQRMLSERLPKFEDFRTLRDRLDPEGVFLNESLAALFT
jgi:FAD-linked oxidoreductase